VNFKPSEAFLETNEFALKLASRGETVNKHVEPVGGRTVVGGCAGEGDAGDVSDEIEGEVEMELLLVSGVSEHSI